MSNTRGTAIDVDFLNRIRSSALNPCSCRQGRSKNKLVLNFCPFTFLGGLGDIHLAFADFVNSTEQKVYIKHRATMLYTANL